MTVKQYLREPRHTDQMREEEEEEEEGEEHRRGFLIISGCRA